MSVNVLTLLRTLTSQPFLDIITVIDQVLQASYKEPSLDALRVQATWSDLNLTFYNRILLYKGKVIVLHTDYLQTYLIWEVYD
jgi:hypothetical protein